jgi:hypothetical protein
MDRPSTNELLVSQIHEMLVGEGYKLVEDAWKDLDRRTYLQESLCGRITHGHQFRCSYTPPRSLEKTRRSEPHEAAARLATQPWS